MQLFSITLLCLPQARLTYCLDSLFLYNLGANKSKELIGSESERGRQVNNKMKNNITNLGAEHI